MPKHAQKINLKESLFIRGKCSIHSCRPPGITFSYLNCPFSLASIQLQLRTQGVILTKLSRSCFYQNLIVAFVGVTNAHGPSPQPTPCRSPTCSLTTATGSNHEFENSPKPTVFIYKICV